MADLDSPVARHHIRELLRQLHEFEDEVGFEELGRVLSRLFELYLSEACEKGYPLVEVADMAHSVVKGSEILGRLKSIAVKLKT